jgi:hypothetical protein
MPISLKKITLLFLFSSLLFFACGPDGNHHSDRNNFTGTYETSLIFPQEVPRMEPNNTSISKLINGGIDCDKAGIATLTFSFFSASDDPIANSSRSCEEHQAIITNIPTGSGITLEILAEDEIGMGLLRGVEKNIIIRTNQTTDGNDIRLYPVDSPSVTLGEEPKTLVFSWEHIQFSDNVDHFQLQVNPDGESRFNTIEGADFITDTQYKLTIPVHLTDWGRALYQVVALDAVGNVVATSNAIDLLTTVAAEEVIGYFKASNTESNDLFGEDVALSGSGNILAVGAHLEDSAATGINGNQNDNRAQDAGAVYVFSRENDGIWHQEAYLKASNTDPGDEFGARIAMSADGSTLAVRSYDASAATGINGNQNDNSAEDAGAVYVFNRSASGEWNQQAYIKASNTDAGDRFGHSIALSFHGNSLAVGARHEDGSAIGINGDQDDNSAIDAGAVYLFNRNSRGEWEQEAYIKASNTDIRDIFGISVALSDDGRTLSVGAIHEDSSVTGINGDESDNSAQNTGAVYIFGYATIGGWYQQAYIKASNPDNSDGFGRFNALSADGNTLAVCARLEDSATTSIDGDQNDNSAVDAGAVYIFTRSSSGSNAEWRQQAYIKASNSNIEDHFGLKLDLSSDGNHLAVGARFEDSSATGINNNPEDNSATNAGAVYLFTRNNSGEWRQQAYIKASNTDNDEDLFGTGIALSADGHTLVVGSVREDSAAIGINGNQSDKNAFAAGAVYLY